MKMDKGQKIIKNFIYSMMNSIDDAEINNIKINSPVFVQLIITLINNYIDSFNEDDRKIELEHIKVLLLKLINN